MFKHLAAYVLIVSLSAAGLYWQHRQIISLSVDNKILNGNLEAVEKMREDDQKRINSFTKQVATVKKERENLLIKMENIRNEEVDNFLDQSIPGELRDVIETYLNRERKAADN